MAVGPGWKNGEVGGAAVDVMAGYLRSEVATEMVVIDIVVKSTDDLFYTSRVCSSALALIPHSLNPRRGGKSVRSAL